MDRHSKNNPPLHQPTRRDHRPTTQQHHAPPTGPQATEPTQRPRQTQARNPRPTMRTQPTTGTNGPEPATFPRPPARFSPVLE
ncbi:hypothetical protein GCM10010236_12450 [Streptomyces eurythermus]|nr:hypothetical protein GCM10010236_12450 [Streptomyces eurythermus]